MKKLSVFVAALLLSANLAFSADITFRLTPGVAIPGNKDYSTGFGGTAQLDLDLFGLLTVGVEGLFTTSNIDALSQSVYFYGGGAGLGFYFYPLSRLYIGLGGAGGIYQFSTTGSTDSKSFSDIYYRGYGEIGYRFSPSLTVSANGGYTNFALVKEGDSALDQINVGLSLRYTVPLSKTNSSDFVISNDQGDAAFPLFMSAYKTCPITTITIRNNTGAEVKNVHVSLRAGRYSASTYESANIKKIKKYAAVDIPLYADFSPELLRFTENGKILCELIIDYEFLGKKQQAIQNLALSVYNRNAYSWSDSTALSCFISPDTPEILEISKYIAGIARNNFFTGMNRNVQMAAAMMEALRISGIKYSDDKLTPYVQFHNSEELDSIKYPLQTINTLSGDYDELGILLASCLESVGVATGYLPLDDDFIVLVATETKPGTEENLFANPKGCLTDESTVYFGLSMANFSKGFTKSREIAAKKIQAVLESEDTNAEFTVVHAAWEVYAPAIFSENGSYYEKPSAKALNAACEASIKDYINNDLSAVLARARKTGDANKVGIALMRMGRYAEAKAEFSKMDTVKALNNLATVYMIEKSYNSAASTYKRVLAKDPENKIAQRGLENANAKLGL